LGAPEPPKLRIKVGFRFVVELDGEETVLFFFGGDACTAVGNCVPSIRDVVRRSELVEGAKGIVGSDGQIASIDEYQK